MYPVVILLRVGSSEIIPPLLEGEVGIETDTYKWKIGKIKVGGGN